ncbi:MAG TPA: T9SS type A sorting domain-containing protein [Acidobacteriota bacterium]|nr:T9SS type A sorting domain-containing protein [Acidobacteriota bacterium]
MKKTISIISALGLMLIASQVMAQAGSANYLLTNGGVVGGGGGGTSANAALVGNFGNGPMGVSSSANYTVNGGVIGSMEAGPRFFAAYGIPDEQIVPVANYPLSVTYGNQEGTVVGAFFSRPSAGTSYGQAAMTVGAGSTLQYTIPAASLTVRGLEYYVRIVDQGTNDTVYVGSADNPLRFVCELNNSQGRRPTGMPDAQYRIIGLPVNIQGDNTPQTIFLDDLGAVDVTQWRLGRYEADDDTIYAYPNVAGVKPGTGYWLIARGGRRYGAAGYSMLPNLTYDGSEYYRPGVQLDSGWNQLANPFSFPVRWHDVFFDTSNVILTVHSDAILDDAAYWYDGGLADYRTVNSIPAWEGFFVYIKRSGVKILYPFEESTVTGMPAALAADTLSIVDGWHINLQLASAGGRDGINFAGVRSDARPGDDAYDFVEPPSPPEAPYLAFSMPDQGGLFRTDYRPYFTDGATWDVVMSKGSKRVLMVTGIDQIPDDMQAWLITDKGTVNELTEGMTIELPGDVAGGRLAVGKPEYLASLLAEALPENYELSQSFPNPFNPTATIRFALPNSGNVKLVVYNVLGQHVTALVDGPLEAGRHVVVWEGRDDGGKTVASGVYFYRLTAGKFRDSKKMVFLK